MEYAPREIEQKWQQWWREQRVYEVTHQSDKPKYYVLDMFPYPSGAGLHVGHPLGYIASDILSRYKRLRGFNVLHPMGFDAFGLPAEQYAIENGIHPAVSTADNIKRYKQQLDNLGFCYDWSREVQTCDPAYYRWTQWIFLRMFNSWYDRQADRARPIAELIRAFETGGSQTVDAVHSHDEHFTAAEWLDMSGEQRQETLMNYRLMYRKVGYVNWCEALGTVLANDEVVNGVSERGGHPVEIRPMLQWSMRITAYAERLLHGLDTVDFPEALKQMQRNWIGRSEGAQLFFELERHADRLEIYTTRPDTIFGATFMVLAPEHDLVERIVTPDQRATVEAYLAITKSRTERERQIEKAVSGAFTGAHAVHPFTGKRVPVYIADYVLKGYGTGAIMGVPADDERDQRFAEKFNLPIVPIVDKSMYPDAGMEDKVGTMIHSDFLNDMEVPDAIRAMLERIEQMGIGHRKVQYKLRDANYSRQRYWGEPFPIVYDQQGVAHDLQESELPLELPNVSDFKPGGGKGPLAKRTDWVQTPLPGGAGSGQRDTDTMPGFAGSSWYFLRYMDPRNPTALASSEAIQYWQDVDFYIGGAEHAVGHLLYSRMWHKFLKDYGIVPTEEPYRKLVNQGMIQGVVESALLHIPTRTFVSAELADEYPADELAEILVHAEMVSDYGDLKNAHLTAEGIAQFKHWRPDYAGHTFRTAAGSDRFFLRSEVGKMSKSKYNVVNPDDVVAQYGADCFRMYEMFLGPVEMSKPWDTKGISGVSGFLRKFWGLFFDEKTGFSVSDAEPTRDELRVLHTCIKKVTDDIERFSMNTCVSHFMIATNELRKLQCNKRAVLQQLIVLIAPFAPHIAEELWRRIGHNTTVCDAQWPSFNEALLKEDQINYPVSVNGKLRANLELPAETEQEAAIAAALALAPVQKWLEGKAPKKVIFVKGRMINVVV
ncbi:MAG: leucine--tRNA ligase [Saprospiraceae bacterium]|nr:leucine--tRNA ligase [Saprospiraceae bacterium]